MTNKINQDFELSQGDDIKPIITVLGPTGAPLDISTVADIDWLVHDRTNTQVLSKTKTGGQITFVTTGVDGQFYVQLDSGDTLTNPVLYGWYWHSARLKDGTNKFTVVETGRMLVKKRAKGM